MNQGEPLRNLFDQQVIVALALVLGLPWGLLLLAARPAWLERAAAVTARRRVAAALWGAGLAVLAVTAMALLWNARALRPAAVLVLLGAAANLYSGFAAQAHAQGRAMLGRAAGASPMVWGWLARAGVFAVPFVGAAVGAYLAASAFGAPFVAWMDRAKSTTEPSAGSTPAS